MVSINDAIAAGIVALVNLLRTVGPQATMRVLRLVADSIERGEIKPRAPDPGGIAGRVKRCTTCGERAYVGLSDGQCYPCFASAGPGPNKMAPPRRSAR